MLEAIIINDLMLQPLCIIIIQMYGATIQLQLYSIMVTVISVA